MNQESSLSALQVEFLVLICLQDPIFSLSLQFDFNFLRNPFVCLFVFSFSTTAAGGLLIIAITIFLWFCRKRIEDPPPFLHSRSDFERQNSYLGITIFSYDELEEITNNFDPSNQLGDGGFGIVYYGKKTFCPLRIYLNKEV